MSMVKTAIRLAAILASFAAFNSLHALTLDTFDGPSRTIELSSVGEYGYASAQDASIIGGWRGMKANLTGGALTMRLRVLNGLLSHSQDSGVSGRSWLSWDGNSDPASISSAGLGGIDFTQDGGSALELGVFSFDYPFNRDLTLKVIIYDASDPSGATSSSSSYVLNRSIQGEVISFPFAGFAQEGAAGPADFGNIGAVELFIDGENPDVDMTLDWIRTDGQCQEVPDENGRVIDDCGVCGGNNSDMDLCGVCFGDNSSCLDCAGVPNGGAEYDVCGQCGGDGTSCLDCNGVPNGPAQPDRCGVCNGDGFSCCECTETDISAILADMGKKSLSQYKHNLKEIVRLLRGDGKLRRKLQIENKALYAQLKNLIAEIPALARVCNNTEFCVRVETNQSKLNSYKKIAKKLANLTRKIPKPRGGVCTRTPAECAATANGSQKLLRSNIKTSSRVPGVTSVCD